jgi:hypothetical protein
MFTSIPANGAAGGIPGGIEQIAERWLPEGSQAVQASLAL